MCEKPLQCLYPLIQNSFNTQIHSQIFIRCQLYGNYCNFNSGNLSYRNNCKIRKKLDIERCSVHYYLK